MSGQYCVHIITNRHHTTLYTGVTNDLKRRVYEHKSKAVESFSNTLDNSQGAAQSYADTMRDTLPEAERRFGESLGELQTQIGSDFAPLKMQLMEDGRSLVDAITQGVATGDFSGVLPALAVLWQDVLSYFQFFYRWRPSND